MAGLTDDPKAGLNHVLLRLKKKQEALGDNCVATTTEDITSFSLASSKFNMWVSGSQHSLPEKTMLKTTVPQRQSE